MSDLSDYIRREVEPLRRKLDEKERERVRAAQKALRYEFIICEAASFLENRRDDGLDFPFDSRPMRVLRETADKIRSTE